MKSNLASAVFAAVLFALAKCQAYPRLMHGEGVLANNSYIYRDAIGEAGDTNTLKCVTNFANCCRSDGDSGSWYDEQGQEVQFEGNDTTTFYITAGDGEVSLNRRRGHSGGSVGLWRCDIPDTTGIKKSLYIYIGTYAEGEGTLNGPMMISYTSHMDDLKLYQDPQFTLTCRSEGGPVTTVEWKRKNSRMNYVIVEEDRNHETSQLVLNTSRVTVYENRLRVRGREGGKYRCKISNNIPEYFENRTYLSHNTSFFTVEVAEKPKHLIVLRDSNTSLYVNWDLPSTVPIGYVIYYWLDRTDIQQVNISNGTTQHHVLEGLESGANYNISMLALSQHLPSATVGSPIMSVVDMIPSVVVSTTNENPVAGTSYVLKCTVTLLPGMTVTPVILWEGPGVGTGSEMTNVTSSGEVHSRSLTFSRLTIAHGGTYVCTANYTLYRETSRNGSDSATLSVIIPQPSMSITIVADRPVTYVGNNVSLECIIKLNNAISNSDVDVNAVWLKDGRSYSGQPERVVISHTASGNTTHTTITFNYLMSSDEARYQCQATLVPLLGNSHPKVESRFYDLTTIVPSLIVQTSPSIVRILNVWPYNQFTLTCTAWAQVQSENVPIQMDIKWIKRVEILTDSGRDLQVYDVPTENYTVSGSSNNNYGYQSILAANNETNAVGKTSYHCQATILRSTNDFKHEFRASQIAVVGPTNPVLPSFVRVIASNSSSATIQWMISSIAYTPETYVVRYGLNFEELDMTSEEQHSGSDIRIADTVYTTELSNLQPSVTYFYRIRANNSVRATSSGVRRFITKELMTIESSGDVQIGQPHTLSCIVAESTSGPFTSLMWIDSSSRILRRSDGSGSRLELEFPSLTLSDVSNYTCKVTYSNGDRRELTKEVIAAVPPPHVSLEVIEGLDIIYAGLNLTLQCNVTLVSLSDVHVDISLEWFKSGDRFMSCSELKRLSGENFHCYMNLTHLSYKADNGSYSCRAVITPKERFSFLKPQTVISNKLDLNIAVPMVNVEISSSTKRLLDVPPYNQFTGSCSGVVTIPGLDGPLRLSTDWQWRRKEEGKGEFSDVTDLSINNGFTSMLTNIEVRNGSVNYQCVFSLEGVDNISTYDTATISVIGVRAPDAPKGVLIAQTSPDSAIIQWTIPAIVYTPESYLVVYGTQPDSLFSSTETLSSGDDITATERVYAVELKHLDPGTKYYFFVAAVNSYNSSKTELSFLYTKQLVPGPVSFINVTRLNDTSWRIHWGAAHPPNGNITHYLVWVNSTSDSHLTTVPLPTSREVIISGLTHKAMYKVYVAAVNGAGVGEWRETKDAISTEGLRGCCNDEGDGSGVTVGTILAVVLLLAIIGIIVGVVLSLYIRKRRLNKRHIQIEDKVRSHQLNNATKKGMVEAENDSTKQKAVPGPTKTNGVSAKDGSSELVHSEKKERGAERHTIV